jgi:hypothetical protein
VIDTFGSEFDTTVSVLEGELLGWASELHR